MSTEFINDQWRLPNNENKDKQSNYSMDFDTASTNGINCGTVPTMFIGDSSVSIWFKSEVANSNNVIFGRHQSGSGNTLNRYVLRTELSGSGVKIKLELGTTGGDFYSQNVYSKSVWHHLVCTLSYSGGQYTVKFYVDGVEDSPTNSPMTKSAMTSNNTIPLIIGGMWNWNSTITQGCRGLLDGVAIFDYALTDGTGGTVNQIAALYGSSSTGIGNPMSLSTKPVAYYPLGDQDAFNGSNYLVPNSSLKDYVFDFDAASGDEINTNYTPPTGASARTISIWFYQETSGNADICGYGTNTVAGLFDIILYAGNVYVHGYGAGQEYGKGAYTVGVWNHYVITYDGTTAKGYVNNVATPENTVTLSTGTTNTFKIGNGYYNIGNFTGKLSNCSIWNTALTSTQVTELYNNGTPSNISSHSATSNLISWWKLDASDTYDSSTGNWTIEDHAGSNDGTSSGMTQANLVQSDLSFTSGYSPYALDFDAASNNKITGTGTLISGNDSRTISLWYKTTSTVSQIPFSLGGPTDLTNGSQFAYSMHTATLAAIYGKNSSYDTANFTVPATNDGNWHHLVVTYDQSSLNVYIDGNLEATPSLPSLPYVTSAGFTIGGWSINNNRKFNGQLSNISIWNTDLTSAQVSEIYSEGVPQNLNNHSAYSNLVSWWQLGSNSSFNSSLNQWTCIDEKGTNTGVSNQTFNEDAIVDGVGSYANGLGNSALEVVGDAPYSTANALSVNMDVLDRVEDTPS